MILERKGARERLRKREGDWNINERKTSIGLPLVHTLTKDQTCRMWTPASRVHVLWLRGTNSHGLQKSCGEKGMAWPPSEWERGPTPAWTGFYCFSGYITLRMVLLYYAQVRCRWLPFTDNTGKNVAYYFKEKDVADQGEKVVELVTLHTWEV